MGVWHRLCEPSDVQQATLGGNGKAHGAYRRMVLA